MAVLQWSGRRPAGAGRRAADAVEIAGRIGARDHIVFFGALHHREALDLREKVTVGLVRAADGDYGDWPAVRAWTDHIAAALTALTAVKPLGGVRGGPVGEARDPACPGPWPPTGGGAAGRRWDVRRGDVHRYAARRSATDLLPPVRWA